MDVSWNEVIENNDVIFLFFIYLEKVKFVIEFNY